MGSSRVIDWEELLAPCPGERPGGKLLRASAGELQELAHLLRPDVTLAEEVGADGHWRPYQVIDRAKLILRDVSKDLRPAIWMLRCLTTQHGLAGLRDGLQLINGLLDRYWDEVGPLPDDDGDLEARYKALEYFCREDEVTYWLSGASLAIELARFKKLPEGDVDLTLNVMDTFLEMKKELESALSRSQHDFLPRVREDAEEALAAVQALDETISARTDPRWHPGFEHVRWAIWSFIRRVEELYRPRL